MHNGMLLSVIMIYSMLLQGSQKKTTATSEKHPFSEVSIAYLYMY